MPYTHADGSAIKSFLPTERAIGITVLDTVNSTNTYAKGLQDSALPMLVLAREQTLGRGRFDRRFDSARDGGLYMSLCFCPEGSPTPAMITAAAGVAVCLAIERLTDTLPKIKWVNDVYIGERKVAGILAEGSFDGCGRLCRAVVGIGVNTRSRVFPEPLRAVATSIEDATGFAVDINRLCTEITEAFFSLLCDKAKTMRLYQELSLVIGRAITVITMGGTEDAVAEDIDGEGNLIIRNEAGEIKTVCTGEISIRLKPEAKRD